MATTTMQLDVRLRDELADVAKRDFGGVPLAEALRRLVMAHRMNRIVEQYEQIRSDPEEWASYQGEAQLTDSAAGDGLPFAADEFPEYNR